MNQDFRQTSDGNQGGQEIPPAQPPQTKKKKPWLIIGLGTIVVLLLTFYFVIYRGTINISIVQEGATIQVGGKTHTGSFNGKVRAGNQNLIIELPNFVTLNENLQVGIGQTIDLNIDLRPNPIPVEVYDGEVDFVEFDNTRQTLVFVDNQDGHSYRATLNLSESIIDRVSQRNGEFTNATNFTWSPDRLLAFYTKENQVNQINFRRIDLVDQQIIPWPEGTKSIDWSNDGTRIAYYFAPLTDDPQQVIININQVETERVFTPVRDERSLIIADINNLQYNRVFDFKTTDITEPKITWSPDGQKILAQDNGLHIFEVNVRNQIQSLELNENVVNAIWLSDNSILYQNQNGNLKITDLNGNITETDIQASLENTTLIDGDLVIASLEGGQLALSRINLGDFSKINYLLTSNISTLPTNLVVVGQNIYFVHNGILYGVRLDDGNYTL